MIILRTLHLLLRKCSWYARYYSKNYLVILQNESEDIYNEFLCPEKRKKLAKE